VAALLKWSAGRLSTYQSSYLKRPLEFMVLFQRVQIRRALEPVILLSDPVRFQLVLHDARTLGVVLVETA